ncbi:MAG: hypothetical protein H7Y04_14230 [Verrucomicrobia bacterium]|nr:hypothetical protein [Cytophagales bacterium]
MPYVSMPIMSRTPIRTLDRNTRISMFFHDYYFGYAGWVSFVRMAGGPLIIGLGLFFYNYTNYKYLTPYGGFTAIWGLYYTLKLVFWVLHRLGTYKSVDLSVEITDLTIRLKDEISESVILFEGFYQITKKKFYYVLAITKTSKLYLPFEIFTTQETKILDAQVKPK